MPKQYYHRYLWLLVVPLLLLTTGLAARSLNSDAIWYDEYWSLYYAGVAPYERGTLIDNWNFVRDNDFIEPPGNYLVLGSWGALAGATPYAMRALMLLEGLLAVAMTYRLGRDLVSPLVGIGAAVALGVSAFFIDYLHEIRNYTLYVFLVTFFYWSYWRIASQRAGRWIQAGFVLGIAALLYLHYYAGVVLGTVALFHLLFIPKRREWWRVVILMGLGGALFLPWVGYMARAFSDEVGDSLKYIIPILTPEQVVRLLLQTFSNGSVALLALVVGMALLVRMRAAGFAWFCTLTITGAMVLANHWTQTLIHIRHLLAVWPLLAVIVGIGIARMGRGGIHPALPLAIWIVAGIGGVFDPAFVNDLPNAEPRMDRAALDATLDVLEAKATADDVIVLRVPAGDDVIDYYLHDIPAPFQYMDGFYHADGIFAPGDFIDEAAHVWFVTAPDVPPFYEQEDFFAALNAQHVYCDTPVERVEMRLERYALVPDEPGAYQFGEGIRLTLLDPLPDVAGDDLPLLLGWTLDDAVPRQTYSVGLHIENAAGELVAQADYGLPGESFNCAASDIPLKNLPPGDNSWLFSSVTGQDSDSALVDLPPGEYTLYALVYDWQTGERLPIVDLTSGLESDRLPLGTFTID